MNGVRPCVFPRSFGFAKCKPCALENAAHFLIHLASPNANPAHSKMLRIFSFIWLRQMPTLRTRKRCAFSRSFGCAK